MASARPDDHRRKWDRSEYQKIAMERIKTLKAGEEESKGKILIFSLLYSN